MSGFQDIVIMPSPETLGLAEQHDIRGRHDAAIDTLARGVREGNVEAMTRLGKRLLVGDRAPLLPREGVRFLIDAVGAGGAEAAERLAVLAATGAYTAAVNWEEALSALTLAAQRGWIPARAQLCALAGDPIMARRATLAMQDRKSSGAGGARMWRELASTVDMPSAREPATAIVLSGEPSVRAFPEFISDEVCDWLIERSGPRLTRARVYDSNAGGETVHATRSNRSASFNLLEADLVQIATQTRIATACGMPLDHLEPLSVLHYDPGERFDNHFDFVNPTSPHYASELARQGQRRMTFLIYLNDAYEGGETDFPRLSLRHRGKRREGLCFVNAHPDDSPDRRMLHAGLAPTRGEKWIVSQFVRSRRVLGGYGVSTL
jgi:hypothetical protein